VDSSNREIMPCDAKHCIGMEFSVFLSTIILQGAIMNEQIQLPAAFRVQARVAQEMQKSAAANMPESVKAKERSIILQKCITYVKNPFTLALTTWVVIAVLFLIDIFSK